jgi:SAM-dependent methyltransferase
MYSDYLPTSATKFVQRVFRNPALRSLRNFIRPFFATGSGGEQWLRIVMDQETTKLVSALNPGTLKVLEISGHGWDRPGLFREYKSLDYKQLDICEGVLDETFDLIIAEQVFEHLLWPYRAGKNVYAMLRPGGHFLITTPFLVKIHNCPVDCTRWTEVGMKYFLAECGFPLEEVIVGTWGNRACINANFGERWQIYQSWRHSLRNDPDLPITLWALAKKP